VLDRRAAGVSRLTRQGWFRRYCANIPRRGHAMRRFLYLAVATTIIVSGLAFFAQTKLLAAGAPGPQQVTNMYPHMYPLDIYWARRPF
jgi:hypothetical protein